MREPYKLINDSLVPTIEELSNDPDTIAEAIGVDGFYCYRKPSESVRVYLQRFWGLYNSECLLLGKLALEGSDEEIGRIIGNQIRVYLEQIAERNNDL